MTRTTAMKRSRNKLPNTRISRILETGVVKMVTPQRQDQVLAHLEDLWRRREGRS